MKARLEEAILGTIGARQEMVRRSRGERGSEPGCTTPPAAPNLCLRDARKGAHFSQKHVRASSPGPRGSVFPVCPHVSFTADCVFPSHACASRLIPRV